MKVVLFDGSARPGGSISALLARVCEELRAEGIETETLRLEKNLHTGCTMCGQCAHRRDLSCSRPPEDGLRRCVRKLVAADGVVIGSPAYSARCSPATQALMVRAAQARRAGTDHPLACKVAGAVVDVRAPGSAGTCRTLTGWFAVHGMIVVRQRPSTAGSGATITAADHGEIGMEAMAELGRTMAWTLKRLKG
jgi:multimeric flavodoxin WrbA